MGIRWVYGGYTVYMVGKPWVYNGYTVGYLLGIRWVYDGYTPVNGYDVTFVSSGLIFMTSGLWIWCQVHQL